jgi:3-hydroxyacyl-CoA dehydrogenase
LSIDRITSVSERVRLTRDGDVAVIHIDNPPVNALSAGVPEGLASALAEAASDAAVRAVVIIGAGNEGSASAGDNDGRDRWIIPQ